jgi:hypothetical protein
MANSPLAKALSTAKATVKGATGNYGQDSVDAANAIGQQGQAMDQYTSGKTSQGGPGMTKMDQGSSPKDKVNPKAQYGDKPGEQRINTEQMTKPLGLKKGAKIKKTRIVRVHAKEAVLPKSKTKTASKIGLLKGLQTV